MSALSSEWSSPFSGEPPEMLSALVAQISRLVHDISTPQPAKGSYPIPDRPRVVSVFGRRGTGKSTLLQFVARHLSSDEDYLVLPIIDPEAFVPGDSLAGWVFAHIERTLETKERAHELHPGGHSLEGLLDDLRRTATTRGSSYLEGLRRRGLTFTEYTRDAAMLPAHSVRATERVAALLDGLARARDRLDLRVVIPVDDADLFPELLPDIVRDAQLLSASPRVVLLFAADRATLARALQLGFVSANGEGAATALRHRLLEPDDVAATVARRMVKHFPRSLRIELPTLTPEQRLAFQPITAGSAQTLFEALSTLMVERDPARSLAEMFVVRDTAGRQLAVSPYALSLSQNARDIRQLHEAISAIEPSSPDAASRGVWTILRHGLDGLQPELPPRASEAIAIDGTDRDPTLRFDFSHVGLGKSTGGGVTVFVEPADLLATGASPTSLAAQASTADEPPPPIPDERPMCRSVSLRRIRHQYAVLTTDANRNLAIAEEQDEQPTAAQAERRLPEQFAYLALLAWEATHTDGEHQLIQLEGHIHRLTLPGGQNASDHVVGHQIAVDWVYWTLPEWEQTSDIFTCHVGWEHLIREIEGPGAAPNTSEWLELALLTHLALIVGVQRYRAVPRWIADLTHDELEQLQDPERWSLRSEELLQHVGDELRAAFASARSEATQRNADFLNWVGTLLPLLASRLLTTARMSEWILNLWRELVPPPARSAAAAVVARYARDHMARDIADGDIALLEALDPSNSTNAERAKSLRDVRAGLRRQHIARQRAIVTALQKAGVERPMIEALRRDGATTEVLQGLVLAGLGANDLPAIAEAFPPVAAATSVKDEPRPITRADERTAP
jgi:hypothetical protein